MDDRFLSDNQPVRKVMEKEGISFVAFSPLGKGLLLGKYSKDKLPEFEEGDHRRNSKEFKYEFLASLEPKIKKLKEIFGDTQENLVRAALQYLLSFEVTGAVIPGFRNLEQVKMNLSATDNPLNDEEVAGIKNIFRDMQKY